MKTDMKYAVAVLVDGDNASFENLEDVMGFVSRHGNAIIRRIYGDWTRKPLSGWKDAAGEHGFRLVQASSFTSGKNTTDIALVIDAMDILRDGLVGCFCLVASDGDYTLLAQRIREAGLPVLGYGESKTNCFLRKKRMVYMPSRVEKALLLLLKKKQPYTISLHWKRETARLSPSPLPLKNRSNGS